MCAVRLSKIALNAMHHVIRNDKRGPVRPTGISQTHGSKDRSKTSLSISMSYLLQCNPIFRTVPSCTSCKRNRQIFQIVSYTTSALLKNYQSQKITPKEKIYRRGSTLFCNKLRQLFGRKKSEALLKINILGTIKSLNYQM